MSLLSKKLKFYRINCGFSQFQVACVLNIDRSTYTYYETGKTVPSASTIIRLARIFNIPYSELFDCVGEELYAEGEFSDYDYEIIRGKKIVKKEIDTKVFDLPSDEQDIIIKYRLLSSVGKEKLVEYLSELK